MHNFSSDKIINFSSISPIQCGDNTLYFNKCLVMGILNLTPDSFFDGGIYARADKATKHIDEMIENGADIIDVGAVSTRPGSVAPDEEEEIYRLLPVLKLIKKKYPKIIFSVDTYRAKVAEIAAGYGVGIINDVSGGKLDQNLFETVRKVNLPYILMHMQGDTPENMQKNPTYGNVVDEVKNFMTEKVYNLNQLGINKIIIDPGFGFGKTIKHNYQMLKNLHQFQIYNCPILVGLSHKSMIYKVLETNPQDALAGSCALHFISVLNGANILRVHDVKETVDMIKLAETYKNA